MKKKFSRLMLKPLQKQHAPQRRLMQPTVYTALFIFSLVYGSTSQAIENSGYLCRSGDQVRAIHIVYPNRTLVPCEVQYIKHGTLQVLWSAQNQTGYCERKASEFVEKQKSWGWSCSVRSLTNFVTPQASLPEVTFTAIPAEE